MYQFLKSNCCLLCGCALCTPASVFNTFPRQRIFSLLPEINAVRDVLIQFHMETESDLMNNTSASCTHNKKSDFQLRQVELVSCWLCWQEASLQQRVYYVHTRYSKFLRTRQALVGKLALATVSHMGFLANA